MASTIVELAQCLALDAGSVSRLVDRLEAKRFVRRLRSERDRRVVRVEITELGEEAIRHVPEAIAEVMELQLRGFSPAETKSLLSLLTRVVDNGGLACDWRERTRGVAEAHVPEPREARLLAHTATAVD